MPLVQERQRAIVHRLDGAGHEETAGLAQPAEQIPVLQQVLDLDGDVVRDGRMRLVQGLDHAHGVGGTVEEVRITKGDVPRAGGDLRGDIREHHLRLHHAKLPLVDRDDRTVAAEMPAAAAGFRVARDHTLAPDLQRRVARKRRETCAIGHQELQARQRRARERAVGRVLWTRHAARLVGRNRREVNHARRDFSRDGGQLPFELATEDIVHTE